MKAYRPQAGRELVGGVIRQQNGDVLVHVPRQQVGIEVVTVQVTDVKVIGLSNCVPVQPGVVGKWKPRTEERRRGPRIAQHASGRRLEQDPRMTETSNAHPTS